MSLVRLREWSGCDASLMLSEVKRHGRLGGRPGPRVSRQRSPQSPGKGPPQRPCSARFLARSSLWEGHSQISEPADLRVVTPGWNCAGSILCHVDADLQEKVRLLLHEEETRNTGATCHFPPSL